MERTLGLTLLGIISLLAASCGENPTPDSALGETVEESSITLGIVPKSTGGDFWETVEKGARDAAAELGIGIKWEGTITETEFAEQNKIVENMINLGVDGIALAPLNDKAQVKFAQGAVDAGIPVVIFDSSLDWDGHSSFVATDNRKGGEAGARHLVELLGEKKRVMVMRFIQGAGSTEARAAGFIEVAKETGLQVLADPYPDTGTIEGAKNAAVNTLEGFVADGKLELDGIFACNLYSTLGVDSALGDLRKSGIEVNISFVGFDTSKKLIQGVQEGGIQALVSQDPNRMGYLAVKTLHDVVTGKKVEPFTDTGVTVVTKEGLENDPKIRALVGLK
jgi:ribose transport system substrate-binding protein